VIGAILFERTMDGSVDGKPTPQALIDKGVVPFIKIDKGLEDEANGVQMMKPMPELDALLAKSKALGVYGTKERSVINSANREGIAAIVKQQFEVGAQVKARWPDADAGARSEHQERDARRVRRDPARRTDSKTSMRCPKANKVMLKLSAAGEVPGTFDSLSTTPRCCASSRSLAASSAPKRALNWPRTKASSPASAARCWKTCASQMSDAEFDASLGGAIDEIYKGSTQKTA
jgi:fructose-bisphosphate aldolase class I